MLRKWKPNKVPIPFASLCIASRRSGKSYLIRYLYLKYWHKKFDAVVVICPTDFNDFYPSFISGSLFFDEYDPDILEGILKSQQDKISNGEIPPNILVILDDCSDENEKYAKTIQRIYTSGRHYAISLIYCVQGTTLTGPQWRNNADFVLIGRSKGGLERTNIVNNFLVGNADEDELGGKSEKTFMMETLKKNTQDYNFLVIDNNATTDKLEDVFLTFKAKDDVDYDIKIEKPKKRDAPDVIESARKLLQINSDDNAD